MASFSFPASVLMLSYLQQKHRLCLPPSPARSASLPVPRIGEQQDDTSTQWSSALPPALSLTRP